MLIYLEDNLVVSTFNQPNLLDLYSPRGVCLGVLLCHSAETQYIEDRLGRRRS